MSYILGVDIGTTFTAAAITRLDHDSSPLPQPLSLGLHRDSVPSVLILGENGDVLVGEAAERRAIDQPDRLVREFKRRIGDTVPIIVGDLCVAPEDIFAIMARWVVDRAAEREGAPPDAVTITHPASWGEYKTTLVATALAGVGLADVTLLSEPQAAALHYSAQERVEVGSTIAVYDLGGGTFDAATVHKTSSGEFGILGAAEGIERLGGADFDEVVFRHVTDSLGDALAHLDTTDPEVLLALARVRRECVEAKEALSFDSEASIPVLLPGVHTRVRLVRSEFESMITGSVNDTIESLNHALQSASVASENVSTILLIGGSSRIPLVAELLSDKFNRPIAIDVDPKASIALGAALWAVGSLSAHAGASAEQESLEPTESESAQPGSGTPASAFRRDRTVDHPCRFPAGEAGCTREQPRDGGGGHRRRPGLDRSGLAGVNRT